MPDLTPDVERELVALDDALAGRRVAPDLSELGALALALREERPEIDDGFARQLDTRVERGFPGRDPRRRVSSRRWWSALLSAPALGTATAVLLIAVIVVADPAGDSDGGGGGSSPSGGSPSAQTAGARDESSRSAASGATAAKEDAPAAVGAEESDAATVFSVPPASALGSPRTDGRARRSVERSASIMLAARSRDIDTVSAGIQAVTRRQDGFVVSSTVDSSEGGEFELRVPSRNLDAAMAELARLGNVRARSQSSQDITAQAVSARSRLKDARTERRSLLRQLGEAVTLTQTESIRARLELVSREIERARAAVRRVNNRAAFATVAVTLVADNSAAPAPADDNWTPGDAAKDALRVLEVAAGIALLALAVALPLALLGALAAAAARWTRRRRREQVLDAI